MILPHLFTAFVRVGLFGFGGGYAMIPIMEEELVSRTAWLSLTEFVDILAVAEVTPGPVSINAATFVGFKVAGFPGSLVATLGVICPSFALMALISILYVRYRQLGTVQGFLHGARSAVVALLIFAAFRVSQSIEPDLVAVLTGVGVFALVTFKGLHPIIALVLAAITGVVFR